MNQATLTRLCATTQGIFDLVVIHLLAQARKSVGGPDDACLYRSGCLKCAAGILISDEFYLPALEGCLAESSTVVWAIEKSIGRPLGSYEVNLIGLLQDVHDEIVPRDWGKAFRRQAQRSALNSGATNWAQEACKNWMAVQEQI